MRPPANPELELAGARGASARATLGGVMPDKEELRLCGHNWGARSSIPFR